MISLLCCSLPFFLLHLTIKHYPAISQHNYDSLPSWKFLFANFKNNRGWVSSAYYIFFISRRLLYALTLVFLDVSGLAQSILCAGHSIAVSASQTVVFLLIYRPYNDRLSGLIITLSEISVALVFCMSISFNFDLDSGILGEVETLAIALTYVAIAIPNIGGLINLWFSLKMVLRWAISALQKRREAKTRKATVPICEEQELTPQSSVINDVRPFQKSASSAETNAIWKQSTFKAE